MSGGGAGRTPPPRDRLSRTAAWTQPPNVHILSQRILRYQRYGDSTSSIDRVATSSEYSAEDSSFVQGQPRESSEACAENESRMVSGRGFGVDC